MNHAKMDAFLKLLTDDYLREGGTTEFSTPTVNKRHLKPLLKKYTKYMNDKGYMGAWWMFENCSACQGYHGKRQNLHVMLLSEWGLNNTDDGKILKAKIARRDQK